MSIGKKIATAAVTLATMATGNLGGDSKIKDYVRAQMHSDKRNQPSIRRGK